MTDRRTAQVFDGLQNQVFREVDRMFVRLMLAQWVFGIALALWLSPRTWDGAQSAVHPHVWAALGLGGALAAFPVGLALAFPGSVATRHVIAVSQMLFSALLIHLTGGRIETHFHVFGSLAFLAFYRDWRVLVPATIVVVIDHGLRGSLWPASIFGVEAASVWRTFEHAGWVLFEDFMLILYCVRGRAEMMQVARRTADAEISNERYRAIVDTSTEIIVVFDAATLEILEYNPQFTRGADLGPDALIGVTLDATMIGAVVGGGTIADEAAAAIRGGRPTVSERQLHDAGGEPVQLSCTFAPTTYAGRSAISAMLHDITDVKRFEADLAQARDEALHSARLKSEFLANMSHEIRTPMNGIVGMAGLLLDGEMSAHQRMFARTIQSSADSLLTVINDILDFSKVEAGQLEFEVADFDLRHALEGAVDLLAEPAQAKALDLVLSIEPDVPTMLRGDAGRLRQIVLNLLGNAVKFTDRGEVVVRVSCPSSSGTSARLRIEVRDTGIGIAPGTEARLFQAFVQADGSTTRKYGGTGLGLAISKRLIERMDGEIGVTSTQGAGSTFWFTATFGRQRQVPEPGRRRSLSNRRVLIVDDHRATRQACLEFTRSLGAGCDIAPFTADDVLEAVAAANTDGRPFDLVVVDDSRAGGIGQRLLTELRYAGLPLTVPAVLITCARDAGDEHERREMGVRGRLIKPLKLDQVTDTLRAALGELTKAPASPVTLVTPTRSLEGRRVLVAEDNPVNQKVAVLQLRRLGCRADAVPNGYEALTALKRFPYDIVLMDCQMPELDGFEATRLIRESEAPINAIPIVALTANALNGDRERCLAAGMNDYLSKPFTADGLASVLERWIGADGRVTATVERPIHVA
ncbi:MAG TPA: response regulator [Luteitalea sp.]|nr:response regulator [Luteitalea sp.]